MEIEKQYAVMVEGKQTPSKLYTDVIEAHKEAERLAVETRKTVYVLLAISKVELNDVKITSLA